MLAMSSSVFGPYVAGGGDLLACGDQVVKKCGLEGCTLLARTASTVPPQANARGTTNVVLANKMKVEAAALS
jgi:hypothetical protein